MKTRPWYELAFALVTLIGLKVIERQQRERERQALKTEIVRELRRG